MGYPTPAIAGSGYSLLAEPPVGYPTPAIAGSGYLLLTEAISGLPNSGSGYVPASN